MSENYTPSIGDYVKVNVDVLADSTKGTARSSEINRMKLNDGGKVFKVLDSFVPTGANEPMYILDKAIYLYRACELIACKRK